MTPCSVTATPRGASSDLDHMTQIISAPSTMEKNMVSRCRVHIPSPILKCSRWCNTYSDGVGPEAALKKFTIESSLNFFYLKTLRAPGATTQSSRPAEIGRSLSSPAKTDRDTIAQR